MRVDGGIFWVGGGGWTFFMVGWGCVRVGGDIFWLGGWTLFMGG